MFVPGWLGSLPFLFKLEAGLSVLLVADANVASTECIDDFFQLCED